MIITGIPGQTMGLVNTGLQNPTNVDPIRLQRIQQLQAELQEYQSVGQVLGAQPATLMGQQHLVTGPETKVMGKYQEGPHSFQAPFRRYQI